jgi:hypothetical protein
MGPNSSVKYKMVSEPPNDEFTFGMNIYPVLAACIDTHDYEAWILKALHVLCDHKKLMAERVKYLLSEKIFIAGAEPLIASFDEINRQMLSIRNVYSRREEMSMRDLIEELRGSLEICGSSLGQTKTLR